MNHRFEQDSLIVTSESGEKEIKYSEFKNIIWIPPRWSHAGLLKLDNYTFPVKKRNAEKYFGYLEEIAPSLKADFSFHFIGHYIDKEIFWIHKKEIKEIVPEIKDFVSTEAKRILKTTLIIGIITASFYALYGFLMLKNNEGKLIVYLVLILFMTYAFTTGYLGIRRFMFWGRTLTAPSILGCLIGLLLGAFSFLIIPFLGTSYGWCGGGIYLTGKYRKLKNGEGFYQMEPRELSEIFRSNEKQ